MVEEFKLHAREKKFVVRDFTYNEEELAAGKSEITKLVTDKKKQFVSISSGCLYSAIAHTKHTAQSPNYMRKIVNKIMLLGSTCAMVESEFQRNILRMDSCQSSSRICGICTQVGWNFSEIQ